MRSSSRSLLLSCAVLVPIATAACGSEVAQETDAAPVVAASADADAPAANAKAEEQEIRRLSGEYLRAYRTKDAAAASTFFAEDAVTVYPFGPGVTRGRDAIRQDFERIFSARPDNSDNSWEPSEIKVSEAGGMAHELGTWEEAQNGTRRRGHYLSVWEKINGEWKIVRDMAGPPLAQQVSSGTE